MCYRHRLVVAGIDPTVVEAEAWGARVRESARSDRFETEAPLVRSFAEVAQLPELDPARQAPLASVLRAAARLKSEVLTTVAVPISGPLALGEAVLGRDALLHTLTRDGDGTRASLLALVEKLRPWIRAIAAAETEIAVVEPAYDPQEIPPAMYAACVRPALTALLLEIRERTYSSPAVFVAGDTAPIVQHLCGAGAGYVICPATTNRNAFLEGARSFRDITVRVDLPTTLWNNGDWTAACKAIAEASSAARIHARSILGTGPLSPSASSVMVVDACNFATSMDPWLDHV